MAQKGSGRAYREGLTVVQMFRMLPDDAAAERRFEDRRWSEGQVRLNCGSADSSVAACCKPSPRHCRESFLARFGTAMRSSTLDRQEWVVAALARGTVGVCVRCMGLIADNGLPGEARS